MPDEKASPLVGVSRPRRRHALGGSAGGGDSLRRNVIDRLRDFIDDAQRLAVLTGAGCSTESGIPDYRSPGGAWTRHKPIYYSSFVASAAVRRFYWARSFRGWPRFAAARPNAAHHALAELESRGKVHQLITQNVDDLHQEAGSRAVVQLHGRNRVVVCLDCGAEFPRAGIQERLGELNADWLASAPWHALRGDEADFAPDGDSALDPAAIEGFCVPECERCAGVLKPAVVFFGESVPRGKVDYAMQRVDEADALLVAGSSLTVWSGFRFVKRAADRGLPIAIVNIGPTRGDELATLKIEERLGQVLPAAIRSLRSPATSPAETAAASSPRRS
jgi:NAD-dependent deacetylase sirtuin 4